MECHGEKKQKGKFTLHDLAGTQGKGNGIVRWEKLPEIVSPGDTQPEEESQPDKLARAQVLSWIRSGLDILPSQILSIAFRWC